MIWIMKNCIKIIFLLSTVFFFACTEEIDLDNQEYPEWQVSSTNVVYKDINCVLLPAVADVTTICIHSEEEFRDLVRQNSLQIQYDPTWNVDWSKQTMVVSAKVYDSNSREITTTIYTKDDQYLICNRLYRPKGPNLVECIDATINIIVLIDDPMLTPERVINTWKYYD